ncbi:putative Thioredoxin-like superfamily [Plasmopara halstedii]
MATAPKCDGTSLCSHEHNSNDTTDLNELDLAFDPTLASCCERDEREYKKAMKLKALLKAHDPTSSAVQMRQQLFKPPSTSPSHSLKPACQTQQIRQPSVSDTEPYSDESDDSDDGFGVEAIMAARREQLQQQYEIAAQNMADGYGVVLEKALSQLVQELQDEPEIPRVALVVMSGSTNFSDILENMRSEMTAAAQRFLGTKFYIAIAKHNDDMLRQLRLTSAPTLAVFRRGDCVDSVALDLKTLVTKLSIYWEAHLLPWLNKCNVLVTERQDCEKRKSNIRKEKRVDENEIEQEGFDCGVESCRLRFGYEHEHVGTSQQTKNEIAAWRHSST